MEYGQEHLGETDYCGTYRPEPRPLAAGRMVTRADHPRDRSQQSVSDIRLAIDRATWQSLAVVEAPLLALLFIVFCISVLVTPDFQLRASGTTLPVLYACPFFALTGIPCLFCGMTRSFLAMGSLDVNQSFSFHPLGPALFILLAGLAVALTVSMANRKRIHVSISPALRRHLIAGGAVLLLAAWLLKIVIWRQTGLI